MTFSAVVAPASTRSCSAISGPRRLRPRRRPPPQERPEPSMPPETSDTRSRSTRYGPPRSPCSPPGRSRSTGSSSACSPRLVGDRSRSLRDRDRGRGGRPVPDRTSLHPHRQRIRPDGRAAGRAPRRGRRTGDVRWIQYGPGDLDRDRGSFIEVRRFHFGYLLPVDRDPTQSIVTRQRPALRATGGPRPDRRVVRTAGPSVTPQMLDLWLNDTSREDRSPFPGSAAPTGTSRCASMRRTTPRTPPIGS